MSKLSIKNLDHSVIIKVNKDWNKIVKESREMGEKIRVVNRQIFIDSNVDLSTLSRFNW